MFRNIILFSLLFLFVGLFSSVSAQDVACTKEYNPVCGSLVVQCIRAPCPPIQETYGNKCMMEAAGASYIAAGTCESQDDDRIICPMNYAPVCGTDGITYGNSCMAQIVEVKYEGECLAQSKELRISKAWDNIFIPYASGKTIAEIHTILDKAEVRLYERQTQNTISSSLASLYGFIHFLIEDTRGRFWVE